MITLLKVTWNNRLKARLQKMLTDSQEATGLMAEQEDGEQMSEKATKCRIIAKQWQYASRNNVGN